MVSVDTPEYGPTQTGDWLDCPTLRQFNRAWQQRGVWTPHLALGTAMSDALALYLKNPEKGLNAPLEAAKGILEVRYDDSSEWSLEGLFQLVGHCLRTAANTTLKDILENETVLDTELPIGRGRLDLVTERKDNHDLIVTDHKNKIKLDPRYREEELNQTEQDWQLKDYSWRAEQHYGRPVLWKRKHLMVMTPKVKCEMRMFPVKPEATKQWAASAEIHWRRMAQDEKYPLNAQPMNDRFCIHPKYRTKCPAYDACHTYYRDEVKMEALYERKKHGN